MIDRLSEVETFNDELIAGNCTAVPPAYHYQTDNSHPNLDSQQITYSETYWRKSEGP